VLNVFYSNICVGSQVYIEQQPFNNLIITDVVVNSWIKLYNIICSKSIYDVCNLVRLLVTASYILTVEYGGVNGPSLKPNFVAMTTFCLRPCRASPNTCSDPAYTYI
jgi:hypothetical protein